MLSPPSFDIATDEMTALPPGRMEYRSAVTVQPGRGMPSQRIRVETDAVPIVSILVFSCHHLPFEDHSLLDISNTYRAFLQLYHILQLKSRAARHDMHPPALIYCFSLTGLVEAKKAQTEKADNHSFGEIR